MLLSTSDKIQDNLDRAMSNLKLWKQQNQATFFVTPRPHVHDIVLFGQPKGSLSPLRFCSSPGCAGEKASYTTREGIPYKHIPMYFPRQCGILWNARPPFGSLQSTPLTRPTLSARAWLWCHLSRSDPVCMISSSMGGPKALLVP